MRRFFIVVPVCVCVGGAVSHCVLRTQHMSTNADEGEKKGEESEGRCKNPRGVGRWVGGCHMR